ncbi:EAL domain-containing protein [Litchfieldia alkalitelluris]|uniref:EAL domain-containing protein n=1 Tax=Litchfieldia alkalitelluris TaxID=304268 RepID=UPI001F3FF3DC|nr:sensor domain-containing diguanylate cyclase [Litchfieldia alkalitelluris]
MLFAVFGWFIAGNVARPLEEISSVANRLREGELVEIPPYQGIKEIEVLSNSLRNLITNLMNTETELEKMERVAHKTTTGLPNRNALERYLEKITKRHKNLTILYLDLDGFKSVNDTLGHEAGDKLLIEVGSRLKQNIRSEELVSRIGGDEFVIVLTAKNDPVKNGKIIGERIISMINQPITIDGQTVSVGCSVGGSVFNTHNDNIGEVIRLADQALYQVKKTGKNRVHFF